MRNVKKEMMQVTGGEFSSWYNSLSYEEKHKYYLEFKSLHQQFANRNKKREENGFR